MVCRVQVQNKDNESRQDKVCVCVCLDEIDENVDLGMWTWE